MLAVPFVGEFDFGFGGSDASVEEVNKLVMSGMTFRDAYKKLGTEIFGGQFSPDKKVNHSHEGSIGNLCLKEIQHKFDSNY